MAVLTTDARFGRLYDAAFGKRQAARGMALETAQDGRIGSEGPVSDAGAVGGMTGRGCQSALGLIEALGMLQVVVFVDLGNIGDGLRTGTEGPAVLVAGERRGMVGFGLGGRDIGMTNGTGRRPGWIGGL